MSEATVLLAAVEQGDSKAAAEEAVRAVPHPELHGGKKHKTVWAQLEDSGLGFLEFVDKHGLEHEEGNLFTYLVRVMNFARKIGEASGLAELGDMADRVQTLLGRIDLRLVERRA